MPDLPIELLRSANHELRGVLDRWQAEPGNPSDFSPQALAAVLAELQRATESLRTISPGSALTSEWEKEIAEYRSQVQRLEQILPTIEKRLLTEKVRLEAARAHVAAAMAWAEARKKTL